MNPSQQEALQGHHAINRPTATSAPQDPQQVPNQSPSGSSQIVGVSMHPNPSGSASPSQNFDPSTQSHEFDDDHSVTSTQLLSQIHINSPSNLHVQPVDNPGQILGIDPHLQSLSQSSTFSEPTRVQHRFQQQHQRQLSQQQQQFSQQQNHLVASPTASLGGASSHAIHPASHQSLQLGLSFGQPSTAHQLQASQHPYYLSQVPPPHPHHSSHQPVFPRVQDWQSGPTVVQDPYLLAATQHQAQLHQAQQHIGGQHVHIPSTSPSAVFFQPNLPPNQQLVYINQHQPLGPPPIPSPQQHRRQLQRQQQQAQAQAQGQSQIQSQPDHLQSPTTSGVFFQPQIPGNQLDFIPQQQPLGPPPVPGTQQQQLQQQQSSTWPHSVTRPPSSSAQLTPSPANTHIQLSPNPKPSPSTTSESPQLGIGLPAPDHSLSEGWLCEGEDTATESSFASQSHPSPSRRQSKRIRRGEGTISPTGVANTPSLASSSSASSTPFQVSGRSSGTITNISSSGPISPKTTPVVVGGTYMMGSIPTSGAPSRPTKLRSAARTSKNKQNRPSESAEERRSRNSHNLIEKQYRQRLNESFESLLSSLPDPGNSLGGSMTIAGGSGIGISLSISRFTTITETGDSEGPSQPDFLDRRVTKAEVLDRARQHILDLERDRENLEREKNELQARADRLSAMLSQTTGIPVTSGPPFSSGSWSIDDDSNDNGIRDSRGGSDPAYE